MVKDGSATFAWKPSIGALYRFQDETVQKEFIESGQSVHVNGRELIGPFTLAKTYVYFRDIDGLASR